MTFFEDLDKPKVPPEDEIFGRDDPPMTKWFLRIYRHPIAMVVLGIALLLIIGGLVR